MQKFTLEICANGYTSAAAAQIGGAHRVELCSNLAEGGTTPSIGLVKHCLETLNIPIFPIIRPRGGNFIYNADEMNTMLYDIQAFHKIGCPGIVIGCLDKERAINKSQLLELMSAAQNMEVAFHRAIDRSKNLPKSLETLMQLGIKRVLTSGGEKYAHQGLQMIQKLVEIAGNAIEIMPGSGINEDNILEIKEKTGAISFHTTAKSLQIVATENATDLTENLEITDVQKVKALIKKLHANP